MAVSWCPLVFRTCAPCVLHLNALLFCLVWLSVKSSQGVFIYRPRPSISQLINSRRPRIKLSRPSGCTIIFYSFLKTATEDENVTTSAAPGIGAGQESRTESTFIPLETKEQSRNNKRVKAAKKLPPRIKRSSCSQLWIRGLQIVDLWEDD